MTDLREQSALPREKVAGNTNTSFLKVVALIFMVIDHTGVALFNNMTEMRVLGRIAFPIYAWCMAVGCAYTRSFPKYVLRMLIALVVSQPFYMRALGHKWYELSIMATLLCGLLAIWGISKRRWLSQYWAPALALLCPCFVQMDYGWKGVLLIILLYLVKGDKRGIAAFMIAFCLFWGENTSTLRSLFGVPLAPLYSWTKYGRTLFTSIFRIQALAILSLPFILPDWGKRVRYPRWIGYLAYPGHLAIIYLIKLIIQH